MDNMTLLIVAWHNGRSIRHSNNGCGTTYSLLGSNLVLEHRTVAQTDLFETLISLIGSHSGPEAALIPEIGMPIRQLIVQTEGLGILCDGCNASLTMKDPFSSGLQ
jgi:hypothetical protein